MSTIKVEPAGMSAVSIVATDLRSGRIPFGAIDRYARRYEIVRGEFDTLLDLLAALDDEFIEIETERARERAQARGLVG